MVWFVRKPNKRAAIVAGAVSIGLTVSRFPAGYFPYCASPAGGASAWCWRPLSLHSSREDRGSDRSSKPDLPSVQIAAGRFHRGGGLSFFPSAPAPRGDPGENRCSRDSVQRGGASCVLRRQPCHPTAATRPAAYLPAGRHFFSRSPICQTAPPESRPTSSPA